MTKTYQIELPDDLAESFEIWQIKSQHRTRTAAFQAAIKKGIR